MVDLKTDLNGTCTHMVNTKVVQNTKANFELAHKNHLCNIAQ